MLFYMFCFVLLATNKSHIKQIWW